MTSHRIKPRTSVTIIVASEGVPPEPWKISATLVGIDDEPVGVMNVSTANRALVTVNIVGGRERRKMRIARVSPSGQDLRIVRARCHMLLSWTMGFLAAFTSILRCACSTEPLA